LTETLQVLASSDLPRQIFNFPLNLLTGFYQRAKEFTLIAKPTRKIANEVITVSSGIINLQSNHDLICRTLKVKAATSLSTAIFSMVIISLLKMFFAWLANISFSFQSMNLL